LSLADTLENIKHKFHREKEDKKSVLVKEGDERTSFFASMIIPR